MNMKRKWSFCILFAVVSLTANAQNNEFRKAYDEFRRQVIKDYETFRDKANKEYADFMRQAWEQYQALPEIQKPKDEPPVPPTPYPKDDKDEPIKDTPKPYEEIYRYRRLNLNPNRWLPFVSNPNRKKRTLSLVSFKLPVRSDWMKYIAFL